MLLTARSQHQLEQLRHDQYLIRAAAAWIREQPALGTVAALSDRATAALCADLLEHLAEVCDRLDPPCREHLIRVAQELLGDSMEQPSVRRTRRRR